MIYDRMCGAFILAFMSSVQLFEYTCTADYSFSHSNNNQQIHTAISDTRRYTAHIYCIKSTKRTKKSYQFFLLALSLFQSVSNDHYLLFTIVNFYNLTEYAFQTNVNCLLNMNEQYNFIQNYFTNNSINDIFLFLSLIQTE